MKRIKVIWKYPIKVIFGEQSISIPVDSLFLKFALQDNVPTLWFLVDPNEKRMIEYPLITIGTGHEYSEPMWYNLSFIDTYFFQGLVFHVFTKL